MRRWTSLLAFLIGCAGTGAPAPDDGGDPGDVQAAAAYPLGATPTAGGTFFKVWAPDADHVAVTGAFGRRSLRKLTGGVFAGRVPAATIGQGYTYEIQA